MKKTYSVPDLNFEVCENYDILAESGQQFNFGDYILDDIYGGNFL